MEAVLEEHGQMFFKHVCIYTHAPQYMQRFQSTIGSHVRACLKTAMRAFHSGHPTTVSSPPSHNSNSRSSSSLISFNSTSSLSIQAPIQILTLHILLIYHQYL